MYNYVLVILYIKCIYVNGRHYTNYFLESSMVGQNTNHFLESSMPGHYTNHFLESSMAGHYTNHFLEFS